MKTAEEEEEENCVQRNWRCAVPDSAIPREPTVSMVTVPRKPLAVRLLSQGAPRRRACPLRLPRPHDRAFEQPGE